MDDKTKNDHLIYALSISNRHLLFKKNLAGPSKVFRREKLSKIYLLAGVFWSWSGVQQHLKETSAGYCETFFHNCQADSSSRQKNN